MLLKQNHVLYKIISHQTSWYEWMCSLFSNQISQVSPVSLTTDDSVNYSLNQVDLVSLDLSYSYEVTFSKDVDPNDPGFVDHACSFIHHSIGCKGYPVVHDGRVQFMSSFEKFDGSDYCHRGNHDGSHGFRKAEMGDYFLSYVDAHATDSFKNVIHVLNPSLKNAYMLALYMSRFGRVQEGPGTQEAYDTSAHLFSQYAACFGMDKTYIDEAAMVLKNMTQYPSSWDVDFKRIRDEDSDSGRRVKLMHVMFNWSHNGDLGRSTCGWTSENIVSEFQHDAAAITDIFSGYYTDMGDNFYFPSDQCIKFQAEFLKEFVLLQEITESNVLGCRTSYKNCVDLCRISHES